MGHDLHKGKKRTPNSCGMKDKHSLPVWSDANNLRKNIELLTVLSFIHQPALQLSSDHYYNIISCLSSISLSDLLSVRYSGISEKDATGIKRSNIAPQRFKKIII